MDEELYKRINLLEQKSAVRENQIQTLESTANNLNCDIKEIKKSIQDIQVQLLKRLPAWGTIIVTTLCSLCTGLIVFVIK
jgi:uncharacterized coiled-coil protein SlyX